MKVFQSWLRTKAFLKIAKVSAKQKVKSGLNLQTTIDSWTKFSSQLRLPIPRLLLLLSHLVISVFQLSAESAHTRAVTTCPRSCLYRPHEEVSGFCWRSLRNVDSKPYWRVTSRSKDSTTLNSLKGLSTHRLLGTALCDAVNTDRFCFHCAALTRSRIPHWDPAFDGVSREP